MDSSTGTSANANAQQIGEAEAGGAPLPEAGQLAGASELEIHLGDREAVVGAREGFEPPSRRGRRPLAGDQDAPRAALAPPDPAPQLVELRQAEALGAFDHHHRGLGDVDTDLDDGRGQQRLHLAPPEALGHPFLVCPRHAPVHNAQRHARQRGRDLGRALLESGQGRILGPLDRRVDQKGTAACRRVFA